jgi:hypothetical protein
MVGIRGCKLTNIEVGRCWESLIKERKEERKMRGPRGAWKVPYLDPKGALGGPQQVPQVAPSGPLRASIEGLSRPNCKL